MTAPRVLRCIVEHPHRNLSPWIAGAALAATGLGTILLVAALGRPPGRGEPSPPLPVSLAVAPVPLAIAPAPVADEPAPCEPWPAATDPAHWTMGEDHIGPFVPCARLDRAAVEAMLPGSTVREIPFEHDPTLSLLEVDYRGHRLLTIEPGWTPERGLAVWVVSPLIATPWSSRVGDRVRDLRGRARDLMCMYGAAEGDESVRCLRSGYGDGWVDSLVYNLDVRGLTEDDRRYLEAATDVDVSRLDHLRIASIEWRAVAKPPRHDR